MPTPYDSTCLGASTADAPGTGLSGTGYDMTKSNLECKIGTHGRPITQHPLCIRQRVGLDQGSRRGVSVGGASRCYTLRLRGAFATRLRWPAGRAPSRWGCGRRWDAQGVGHAKRRRDLRAGRAPGPGLHAGAAAPLPVGLADWGLALF